MILRSISLRSPHVENDNLQVKVRSIGINLNSPPCDSEKAHSKENKIMYLALVFVMIFLECFHFLPAALLFGALAAISGTGLVALYSQSVELTLWKNKGRLIQETQADEAFSDFSWFRIQRK